jgi:DNA-binding LytR/AlgR family response regulator
MTGLRVLVVDDEQPALDELAFLLDADERVAEVVTAVTATEGLRILRETDVDAVFLDIQMPGLSGLELAEVLGRFKEPPPVVFVTAHEQHAVEAFELHAVDYVLKPVRAERLAEAVRRVREALGGTERLQPSEAFARSAPADEAIAVELGGVTRFVQRSEVRYAEAHGDYARLHTADGSHLLRVPLTVLEQDWAAAGFVRIHRSHLVALHHIDEMRVESGRWTVRLGEDVLQVSRRHSRELRDMLVHRARPGAT